MNLVGLYSLIGVSVVLVVFFLVKNSRPAAVHSATNNKEDESEHMPQQSNRVADISTNNSLMDDNELIAVISAAIAASMGTQSNIVVRSIRRVYNPTPVWAKTGRSDVMANRF